MLGGCYGRAAVSLSHRTLFRSNNKHGTGGLSQSLCCHCIRVSLSHVLNRMLAVVRAYVHVRALGLHVNNTPTKQAGLHFTFRFYSLYLCCYDVNFLN